MTDEELKIKLRRFALTNNSIHSEKELTEFLAKESQIRDDDDLPKFKVVYMPEFTETESALMFKTHHSFADGLALITLTCNV